MSLNRNKSEEILFQLDLKVFPVNITRGQERERTGNLFSMLMKTIKKLPLKTQGDSRARGEPGVVDV